MNKKIDVLDIQIDSYSAKEAMKEAMEYLQTDLVNVVELLTAGVAVMAGDIPELKEHIAQSDMVLAGERAVLEAAETVNRKSLQEAESHLFLKMFVRYMHKNHRRVFILADTKEKAEEFRLYIETNYSGIRVVGEMEVKEEETSDDLVVNQINGAEADCVLSALSSPLQEAFIARNRLVLNTRIWIGLGTEIKPLNRPGIKRNRMKDFFTKRLFKKEVEKDKRKKVKEAWIPEQGL